MAIKNHDDIIIGSKEDWDRITKPKEVKKDPDDDFYKEIADSYNKMRKEN